MYVAVNLHTTYAFLPLDGSRGVGVATFQPCHTAAAAAAAAADSGDW